MARNDGSESFYFFDLDENLFFLPTQIYLWNAELKEERQISTGEFARSQHLIGKSPPWEDWQVTPDSYKDFRDKDGIEAPDQLFSKHLLQAITGDSWKGPSWPLLEYAAKNRRPVVFITARGHEPATIEAGFNALYEKGLLAERLLILTSYSVTNPKLKNYLEIDDLNASVPYKKRLAIKAAVEKALETYGPEPPHRFGMSDDDPSNVIIAITAMRECKEKYPNKRFFVINTNKEHYAKLEVFSMMHPVAAAQEQSPLLSDSSHGPASINGGVAPVSIRDMDRAIKFYTEQLGLLLKARIDNDWTEISAGGGFVIGLHLQESTTSENKSAVNIELKTTKTLEEVVTRLKERGVEFVDEIKDYPKVRLVTCRDPDGNLVRFAESK